MWKFTNDLKRGHNFLLASVPPRGFPALHCGHRLELLASCSAFSLIKTTLTANKKYEAPVMAWAASIFYNKCYRNRHVTCCWQIHDTHNWCCNGSLFPWFTPSESSAAGAAESEETLCLYVRNTGKTTTVTKTTCQNLKDIWEKF